MNNLRPIVKSLGAVSLGALLMTGCLDNHNQAVVHNLSIADVKLHFRGEVIDVDAFGGKATISDIESGTYDYSTIVALPPGTPSESITLGEGLSGTVTFVGRYTTISIVYTSHAKTTGGSSEGQEQETGATYLIDASVSSSESSANPTGG
jgi:hypothetical protein